MALTFFIELEADELALLVARPGLVEALAAARAEVAVAILDLSPKRAEVLRNLTEHGVPVTAWLVLARHHGYWLTADNADAALHRYDEVRAWSRSEGLALAAVGLDVEMPHDDTVALVHRPFGTLLRMLRSRRTRTSLSQARARYGELLGRIRADGLRAETYQLPFVVDDRKAGTTIVQRATGIVDLGADREVLMLYRSAVPQPWGALLVDAYGHESDGIAVGITGGGVQSLRAAFAPRLLDLPQLLEDLGRARRYTEHLYVFSLEGCVEAELLDGLLAATTEPVPAHGWRPVALAVRRLGHMLLGVRR